MECDEIAEENITPPKGGGRRGLVRCTKAITPCVEKHLPTGPVFRDLPLFGFRYYERDSGKRNRTAGQAGAQGDMLFPKRVLSV